MKNNWMLTSLLPFVSFHSREHRRTSTHLTKTITTVTALFAVLTLVVSAFLYRKGYRIEPPRLHRPAPKRRTLTKTISAVAFLVVLLLVISAYKYWEGYRLRIEPPHLLRRSQKKRAIPPQPRRYRTYNPPKFSDCIRLQTILHDVKNHILGSSSTRLVYLLICQIFYRQLDNPQNFSEPTDDNVKDILSSSWPAFQPLSEQMTNTRSGMIWGYTDETASAHEIYLNPDLITALEKAREDSKLHILLHVILVVTLLHEICHHLMKVMFYSKMPPSQCVQAANGEYGALLEELLVGGNFSGVRKDSDDDDIDDMDTLQELILECRGNFRKLSLDHYLGFLGSIKTENLMAFPFSVLQPYVEKKGFSVIPRINVVSEGRDVEPLDLGLTQLPDDHLSWYSRKITRGGVNILLS